MTTGRMAVASTSSETSVKNVVTLEECSLTYFAGYLAKSCLAKYHCNICSNNLLKEFDLDDDKQLLILNKTYSCCKGIKLKMPSDNLLRLIDMAIICYNIHFNNIVHCNQLKSKLYHSILKFLMCDAVPIILLHLASRLPILTGEPIFF